MLVTGDFLSTLSDQEKQRIKERTDTLVKLLTEWARQYVCIRPNRIPMTALTTAVALPRLSVPDALTTAQMILWMFGVDDKVDERLFTIEEMQHKAEQWYLIARSGPGAEINAGDEFAAVLLEVRRGLATSHLFEPLLDYWTGRLGIFFEAMAQGYQYTLEYNADGPSALPPFDDYLRGGIHSVGFPLWRSTSLILLKDSSVMKCLEAISEIIECAGTAIRLYNDVGTLGREIQEKSINSIIIVSHAMLTKNSSVSSESAISEAKQYILQLADSYAHKCHELLAKIQTDSGQFEESTSNIIALHAYFYGHSEYDYHTTSKRETRQWLNRAV
jgi:hypothetical protein